MNKSITALADYLLAHQDEIVRALEDADRLWVVFGRPRHIQGTFDATHDNATNAPAASFRSLQLPAEGREWDSSCDYKTAIRAAIDAAREGA